MPQQRLAACDIRKATLYRVNEGLLTRTAVTPETIGKYAKPVILSPGDMKLPKLSKIIQEMKLAEGQLPQFELRLLLQLECADGKPLVIRGSKTTSTGIMHLSVDGDMVTTTSPLRAELDALLGPVWK